MNNTSKRMSFDMNEILISERALMIPYLINGDVVFSEEEIYDENTRRIPFKEFLIIILLLRLLSTLNWI